MTGFNSGNGVTAAFGYSPDMMQETTISYSKGATNLFSQSYSYAENGGNDGEVTSVTDNVDAGLGAAYTYDALRRLLSAVSVGSTSRPKWGLSFTYDRYGNRTAQTVTAGSGPSNSVSVSATTNRITTTGYTYDADGNLSNDGHNTLVYDGENRLVSDTDGSGTATYVYNALGQRAIKTFGATTIKYIYDGNRPIIEFRTDAPGSEYIDKEYVYLGNRALLEDRGGSFYYMYDRVSPRATADANGNLLGQLATYPFGEQWYDSTGSEWEFASYLRDSESGNDYAINREYVNRLARFSALDMGQPSSTDPQQFNRYSYVANDPVNRIDPTGKDLFFALDEGCDPDFGDCGCDEFFDAGCGFDEGFGGGGLGFGPFGPGLVCTLCHQGLLPNTDLRTRAVFRCLCAGADFVMCSLYSYSESRLQWMSK